jgi:hypothetical protein
MHQKIHVAIIKDFGSPVVFDLAEPTLDRRCKRDKLADYRGRQPACGAEPNQACRIQVTGLQRLHTQSRGVIAWHL